MRASRCHSAPPPNNGTACFTSKLGFTTEYSRRPNHASVQGQLKQLLEQRGGLSVLGLAIRWHDWFSQRLPHRSKSRPAQTQLLAVYEHIPSPPLRGVQPLPCPTQSECMPRNEQSPIAVSSSNTDQSCHDISLRCLTQLRLQLQQTRQEPLPRRKRSLLPLPLAQVPSRERQYV